MRWRCCVAACLLGIAGAATTARALDVTGNWDAMPFDPNIRQTASGDPRLGYLGVCLPGSGPIGSGTLDTGSGTFTIAFDPVRLFQAGYSLACSWTWSGTFAADGTSFTGTFTFDAFVSQPPPQLGYCSGATTTPISGTRLGAPLPCCGDGVVDVGETCDPGGLPGTCCDEGTCAPKPSGRACASDFQPCTDDVCDGAGTCTHVANTAGCDAGPCVSGTCAAGACVPGDALPAGTLCQTDDDLCTQESCDGHGACVAGAPLDCGPCIRCDARAGCLAPQRPLACDEMGASSRLDLVDGEDAAGDRMSWRWRRDTGIPALPDFGDPRDATTYEVCVYSEFPTGEALVQRKRIAPAQSCDGSACWRSLRRGFAYDDHGGEQAGGIDRLRLRSSQNGRTQLRVDGRGPALGLTGPLTFLQNVSVDLLARDDAGERCWRARYPRPSLQTIERYRAAE